MNTELSEKEIDRIVISEADDDLAWGPPIRVNRKPFAVGRPREIESREDVLGGEPVFRGTSVPVSALFDDLESGSSINEFLESCPTVSKQQAIDTLEYFRRSLVRFKRAA